MKKHTKLTFSHIEIQVLSVPKALNFYSDPFGFGSGSEPENVDADRAKRFGFFQIRIHNT